jgi:hypothetical protein
MDLPRTRLRIAADPTGQQWWLLPAYTRGLHMVFLGWAVRGEPCELRSARSTGRRRRGARAGDRMVASLEGNRRRRRCSLFRPPAIWLACVICRLAPAAAQSIGEDMCAGAGKVSSVTGLRCPEGTDADGVCPPDCEVLAYKDHCGGACSAGPTIAVVASVVVLLAAVAGVAFPMLRESSQSSSREDGDVESPSRGSKRKSPRARAAAGSAGARRGPKGSFPDRRDGSISPRAAFETDQEGTSFENAIAESLRSNSADGRAVAAFEDEN